ncbi:MAG: TonB-dependent receptor [Bacteroidetes bacterium]|nr:TonB-dependent receptor [Bacteroidota bacterium]
MKSAFFLLFATSCSAAVQAQIHDTIQLQDAVIQTNRIQQNLSETDRNITVLDAKTIASLPVKSVSELLSYVQGLDIRQRGVWGAQADVGIMGGSFEQALILIDGVRMSDPQTGHHMMNIPIHPDMIDRIEILKGPAAARYGINALSGAIHIITKTADKSLCIARLYSGSSMEKDSSDNQTFLNSGLSFVAGSKIKNTNFMLGGSADFGNGYRYNTDMNNYRFSGKISHLDKQKNEWFIQAGYIQNKFGANAFYAAPGDKESKEKVETAFGAIRYKLKRDKWELIPMISYRYNFDHYIYIRQNPAIYQNRHFSHVWNPELNFTYNFHHGTLALGAEYRRDTLRSNNLGNRSRNLTGIHADYLFQKWNKIKILFGVYSIYHSQYGWSIFPTLEAGYLLRPGLRLFANAGTAQRLPSYTDLYYKGPLNVSNPNLKPENSMNVEIGIKRNVHDKSLSASIFRRDISNLIDWVRDSVTHPWSPVNYNQVITTGLDIAADYYLNLHWKRIKNIRFRAGYVHLYQSYSAGLENTISKNVLENLKDQFIISANSVIFDAWKMQVSYRYLLRNNMNAYSLLDLHLAYNKKDVTFFADINNILNTQYREISTIPMPPRWFAIGLRFELNP